MVWTKRSRCPAATEVDARQQRSRCPAATEVDARQQQKSMPGSNRSRCPAATEVDVRQQQKSRVISGLRCGVNEIFARLRRYTELVVVLKCQEWLWGPAAILWFTLRHC